jgi:hypothetical protein
MSLAGCSHGRSWLSSSSRPQVAAASPDARDVRDARDASDEEPASDDFTRDPDFIAGDGYEGDATDVDDGAEVDKEDDATPSATPSRRSVQLRSECAETVALLYAEGSTDTTTRLDPGEVESHTFGAGSQVWLLDASEHKLSSAAITASVREVMVGADCTSVTTR